MTRLLPSSTSIANARPGLKVAATYRLTDDGLAFAVFYSKVHNRVLRPLLATAAPQAPPPLRAALRTIEQHIDARFADARLPSAAA